MRKANRNQNIETIDAYIYFTCDRSNTFEFQPKKKLLEEGVDFTKNPPPPPKKTIEWEHY